jgi:hypothetical protein
MTVEVLAWLLAGVVLGGYLFALRRWLGEEAAAPRFAVALVTLAAAALRLYRSGEFPAYVTEDEAKTLAEALDVLRQGDLLLLFRNAEIVFPITLSVIFKATLVPFFGPTRWAIRAHSILCGVLAVPAAFAVGRSFGFRVGPSLALAAFFATLPWALFYGRVDLGISIVFHQLLLLGALVRIVGGRGGWPEVAIGGLALSLLLYDYHPGRAMVVLPMLAAVLPAPPVRRLMCLAIVAIAAVAFVPHVATTGYDPLFFYRTHPGLVVDSGFAVNPERTWEVITRHAQAFVTPANWPDPVLSVRFGSWHPWILLLLAAAGVFRSWRFAFLVLTGFGVGLLPSVLSTGWGPSSRRLLLAYPFLSIAAAAALDAIRPAMVRNLVAAATVAVVAVQSVQLFFAAETWPASANDERESQLTRVLESLPLDGERAVLVDRSFGYYIRPLTTAGYSIAFLGAGNWLPPETGASYGFGPFAAPLRPFYAAMPGSLRITDFGRGFHLEAPAGDWNWMRQHGWNYSIRCPDAASHGWVPTIFHEWLTASFWCGGDSARHRWHGRWNGPRTALRLRDQSVPSVEIRSGATTRMVRPNGDGESKPLSFVVAKGDEIIIETTTRPPDMVPMTALFVDVEDPAAEILPQWDFVTPVVESVSAAPQPDGAVTQSPPEKNATAPSVDPAT